jgi:hypothetical protein
MAALEYASKAMTFGSVLLLVYRDDEALYERSLHTSWHQWVIQFTCSAKYVFIVNIFNAIILPLTDSLLSLVWYNIDF